MTPPRATTCALVTTALLLAAGGASAEPAAAWLCPMHAEIRRAAPGRCPRCGMELVRVVVPSFDEFSVDVKVDPPEIPAGRPIELELVVLDPVTHLATQALSIVHERPLHLFLVSDDLSWFEHVHPEPTSTGSFRVRVTLPRDGRYHLAADFVPEHGIPQLVQRALLTRSAARPLRTVSLRPDAGLTRERDGLRFERSADPLLAGRDNRPRLRVTDAQGAAASLQPWLGASLHALVVSEDLSVFIHTHGEPDDQGWLAFDLRPPRPGRYRVWVQVQHRGAVVTVPFTVQALAPPPSP